MTLVPPRWLVIAGFWIPFAFATYAATRLASALA